MRASLPILIAAGVSVAAAAPPERTVFDRYCAACHNSQVKSGGLALDGLDPAHPGAQAQAWEGVVRKLRARFMPPIGLPRPDEATYDSMVAGLTSALDSSSAAHPNPGRTDTFRRLNRTEYRNAIRDLLALDVDVSELLPSDEAAYGFDNVTVGNLSPTLLERYLNAAQKISRLALGSPQKSPGGVTVYLPPDLTQEQHFDELPLGTRGGLVMHHTFPQDAEYEFQIRLCRDRNEHVEGLTDTHEVELMLDGARIGLFTVKPPTGGKDHQAVDQDLH